MTTDKKIRELPANFVARRNGALVSLADLADEIHEHVETHTYLYMQAFEFLCAKELLEEALSELGFEFASR